MRRAFAGMIFAGLLSSAAHCQSAEAPAAAAPAAFTIADVHQSAHSTRAVFFTGGVFRGGRYVAHNATMLDLITEAYGVDADKVLGGPAWLETTRFDVIAKGPANSTQDALKPMLQALLADRFKLVVHNDSKSVAVFALTVGKGKPKLKEADPSKAPDPQSNNGCVPQQQPNAPADAIPIIVVSCHNTTMEGFATVLRQFAGGYLSNPVVDQTGLKGAWDFDFRWTPRGALARAGADGISIFNSVDKQLGLKLDAQKAPLPVLVVDSANEKPTDNPPGIATALPPPPPAEFEVAVIKPSLPDAQLDGRVDGGQVSLQGVTLKFLMQFAWNLNPNDSESLVGAPKWLDTDKFDIIAKVAMDPAASGAAAAPQIDFDNLQQMLRALLIERFKMVVHTEDRPVSAYTLVADKPKLTKADPLNRTKCKEGPGADGKDPRIANPVLGRLLTCQNMTMAEFAQQLQTLAPGYIYYAVKDATELEGGWDFTLSFSAAGQGQGGGAAPAASGGGPPTASDPSGAISLFEAINKELGLKLVKEKRSLPVLVIDHVEEKPTDN
jgi:uncharacterized protein (TIGR03435 family)